MISAEALAALGGLERGARYNLSHRVARELLNAGLAQPDWGHLGLSEAGRIYLRRGRFNIAITSDDNVSDMSIAHRIDPMAAPHRARIHVDAVGGRSDGRAVAACRAAAGGAGRAVADRDRSDAADAARGRGGVGQDRRVGGGRWVEEFVRALDEKSDDAN